MSQILNAFDSSQICAGNWQRNAQPRFENHGELSCRDEYRMCQRMRWSCPR